MQSIGVVLCCSHFPLGTAERGKPQSCLIEVPDYGASSTLGLSLSAVSYTGWLWDHLYCQAAMHASYSPSLHLPTWAHQLCWGLQSCGEKTCWLHILGGIPSQTVFDRQKSVILNWRGKHFLWVKGRCLNLDSRQWVKEVAQLRAFITKGLSQYPLTSVERLPLTPTGAGTGPIWAFHNGNKGASALFTSLC